MPCGSHVRRAICLSTAILGLLACGGGGGGTLRTQQPAPSGPGTGSTIPAPSTLAERTETRTDALALDARLTIKNRNGSIKVTGWDRPDVEVRARIRDSQDRRVELTLERNGTDLVVQSVFPEGRGQGLPGMSGNGGDVTVKAGGGIFVDGQPLGSLRCDLEVSMPRGAFVTCENTNGRVALKDLARDAAIRINNGILEATGLDAGLRGTLTNGTINIDQVLGKVDLRTSNGRIQARRLDGRGGGISLQTGNGDIDVELGIATGRVDARTGNGSVILDVLGARVVTNLPNRIVAEIPGSGQQITLETVLGSVRVR